MTFGKIRLVGLILLLLFLANAYPVLAYKNVMGGDVINKSIIARVSIPDRERNGNEEAIDIKMERMADAASDSLALIALYNSTNGFNWKIKPWNLNAPISTWDGVEVDVNHRVIQLTLTGRGLNGTLPAAIGDLTALKVLSINNEGNLRDIIPPEIGNLTSLEELYLSFNNLSGDIPVSLFDCKNLIQVSISEPQLSGTLPAAMGNLVNLTSLSISSTRIGGNIPASIGDLKKLETLALVGNEFSGPIPAGIGGLVNLKLLRLDDNQLSGEIPLEIGKMSNVESIRLSANQLEGNIPSTLGDLVNLYSLSLSNNLLKGNIPGSLGKLKNLTDLSLDANMLTGNIPPELGNISTLISLYLQNNQLSGEIPIELGNLKKMQFLYLNNNQLSGELPANLADFGKLVEMNLSGNLFSGKFPLQFSMNAFSALSRLDINNNEFTTLPDLTHITSLKYLAVNDNNLSFDDILPNLSLLTEYKPQDSIGEKLEVQINQGDNYTIDLGIDEGISNNVFQWFKDGVAFRTTNVNKLIFENLTAEDAGEYTVKVTNPGAPDLTLFSRPVTLTLNGPPAFTSTPVVEASDGVGYTYNIKTSDPESDTLTITATTLPAWLALIDNGDGTALLQGIPQAEDCDDRQVTLVVKDSPGLAVEQSFEVDIAVGLDVVLTSDKTEISVGETVKFSASTAYVSSGVQYQWFVNNVLVSGETAASFSTNTLENKDKVKVTLIAEPTDCLVQTEATSNEITITVDEAAPPLLEDFTKTTDEDKTLVFKTDDFTSAVTGSLVTIQITALPLLGTLTLNKANVRLNQEIAAAQLSALRYIPNADVNGEDAFGWNGTNGNFYADDDAMVHITIQPINDPPKFSLSGNIFVTKNFTTVKEITVTPEEVPADELSQTVTYQLIPPSVSFANIIFDPQSGRVAITSVLDQTGKQEFEIVANDGQFENNTHIKTFILEVKSTNVYPPKDISADNLFIAENQPRGTVIGTITVTDDDPNDRHVLNLEDHTTIFFMDGNQLKTNAVLDFEQKSSYEVKVRATDLGGNFLVEPFTITVTDENDLPTDLKISSVEIVENEPVGTQIGQLWALDQDAGDVLLYSLVPNAADNALFSLSDNVLVNSVVFDFEEKEEYEIVVRVDDGNGGSVEEAIAIKVIDVEPEELEIVSGFTPDNDRINDTWEIPGLVSYPRCTVSVYNSWGQEVFFSRGYHKPWDGTHKNENVSVGTYYYIIDLDNGMLPITGNIAVMR